MRRLQIAIVGCGDIASYIALAARYNRRIQAMACVDRDGERASAFARKYRIPKHFTDYEQMLHETDLDAVYLAVPHHLHLPMTLSALKMNRHVLCEKPITITLEDAIEICRFAREKKLKFGVNYMYRYDSSCYALARAAQRGDLGELYYGRCNIPWHREPAYFTEGQWRAAKATAGGGTFITHVSHLVDILIWSLGRKPIAALGTIARKRFTDVEVEDFGLGVIEMDDGSFIQIASSIIATPEQPAALELYGSRGTALTQSLNYFPRIEFRGVKPKRERPPVRGIHALTRSLEAFRRWLTDGTPYLIPAEQSLPVLAATLALYRSAEKGNWEPVDRSYEKHLP